MNLQTEPGKSNDDATNNQKANLSCTNSYPALQIWIYLRIQCASPTNINTRSTMTTSKTRRQQQRQKHKIQRLSPLACWNTIDRRGSNNNTCKTTKSNRPQKHAQLHKNNTNLNKDNKHQNLQCSKVRRQQHINRNLDNHQTCRKNIAKPRVKVPEGDHRQVRPQGTRLHY